MMPVTVPVDVSLMTHLAPPGANGRGEVKTRPRPGSHRPLRPSGRGGADGAAAGHLSACRPGVRTERTDHEPVRCSTTGGLLMSSPFQSAIEELLSSWEA